MSLNILRKSKSINGYRWLKAVFSFVRTSVIEIEYVQPRSSCFFYINNMLTPTYKKVKLLTCRVWSNIMIWNLRCSSKTLYVMQCNSLESCIRNSPHFDALSDCWTKNKRSLLEILQGNTGKVVCPRAMCISQVLRALHFGESTLT